jgi:pimeloyl-ACP methyl ester carboxylesterase
MGDWSVTWARVQTEVAKLTRVCAWDRPGFGFSSASPVPQTVANTTRDLEAALSRGGIEGPYVMVGHSLGGYESLLVADRRRSAVAGMVLVDPAIPDHLARIGRTAPEVLKEMREITPRQVVELRQCAQVVRDGKLTADSAEAVRCRRIVVSPNFSKPLSDALLQWSEDPARFETRASLVQSFDESSRLVLNPTRDYGSMPLIVLSSTIPDDPPPSPPERRATLLAEVSKAQAELARGHEELAALSAVGVHRSVPDVGHFIQRVKPEFVVAAIAETIETVRAH